MLRVMLVVAGVVVGTMAFVVLVSVRARHAQSRTARSRHLGIESVSNPDRASEGARWQDTMPHPDAAAATRERTRRAG